MDEPLDRSQKAGHQAHQTEILLTRMLLLEQPSLDQPADRADAVEIVQAADAQRKLLDPIAHHRFRVPPAVSVEGIERSVQRGKRRHEQAQVSVEGLSASKRFRQASVVMSPENTWMDGTPP